MVVSGVQETVVEASLEYDRNKELKAFDETKAGVKGLVDDGLVKIPKNFVRPAEELAKELIWECGQPHSLRTYQKGSAMNVKNLAMWCHIVERRTLAFIASKPGILLLNVLKFHKNSRTSSYRDTASNNFNSDFFKPRTSNHRVYQAADVLSDGSSIDAPPQNDRGFNSIVSPALPISDEIHHLVQSSVSSAISFAFLVIGLSGKKQIIATKGEKMDIIGSDNISLSITPYTSFHFSNVFLVHKLATNLIFVGQLVDDDNIVSFSRDGCMIQDRRTGKMKGKGSRIGRLFALVFEKPGSYSSFFVPSDSDFSFSNYSRFHVFRYVCFVHLPAHERTKFSEQAVMCVFVGSSADQKGFLCYDPLIRRVRISRHVISMKNVPYYHSIAKSTNSQLSFLPDFSDSIDASSAPCCNLTSTTDDTTKPLSLYGLKQAPKAWFERFRNVILDAGYTQSPHDYSLFTHHTSRGVTLLLLYVDDTLITGNDVEGIRELKQLLCQSFQMKDLGPLTYFLGLQVQHCSCGYTVDQRKYTMDLIKCANLTDQKCIDTPMEPNLKLKKDAGKRLSDPTHYRQLVGCLVYLTDSTRFLGSLQDLHINLVTPTPLYADNTSAIRIASNPVFHERTKHIEVDYHFILDGMISLPYVASQDQIANIFTKPVTQARHDYLVDKLLLSNPPQFEGE
ncbi:hypothetical protein RJ639_002007 [Escallonia herrerae]|uniref:Uncharacterized protein n=1 Tax=Escallonia herrerae TaxID=1293975 RepID=A0AA88XBF4_9ASTE|nr:hypothetical protein RJ639_002007 [Escallonia herrerae]